MRALGAGPVGEPPSSHRAAAARTSSGQGATRWFTIRWRTTTSQPSKRSGGSSAASAGITPADTKVLGHPEHDVGPGRLVDQRLVSDGGTGSRTGESGS